jgi:hypothetical protein
VANLTPKIVYLEIIDAIVGHEPNYIQGALLSPVIQSMKETLSFLNKMEDRQKRQSSNCRPPTSRPENSPSAGATDRGLNPEHQLHALQRYLQFRSKQTDQSTLYRWRTARGFIIKAVAQPAESKF